MSPMVIAHRSFVKVYDEFCGSCRRNFQTNRRQPFAHTLALIYTYGLPLSS